MWRRDVILSSSRLLRMLLVMKGVRDQGDTSMDMHA